MLGSPPAGGGAAGTEPRGWRALGQLRRAAAVSGGTAPAARPIQSRAAFVALADDESLYFSPLFYFAFFPRKTRTGSVLSIFLLWLAAA